MTLSKDSAEDGILYCATSLASCSTLFAAAAAAAAASAAAAAAAALHMYSAKAAALCYLLLPNCKGSHTVRLFY